MPVWQSARRDQTRPKQTTLRGAKSFIDAWACKNWLAFNASTWLVDNGGGVEGKGFTSARVDLESGINELWLVSN